MDLTIVNPGDRDWTKHRYVLSFGAYLDTLLMAYANSLDDALDECVDWIVDNAPGLLADEQVHEEYNRLVAEGMSEEEAQEEATVDTTCAGNSGNYLHSWEWGVTAEDPTREEIKDLIARCGGEVKVGLTIAGHEFDENTIELVEAFEALYDYHVALAFWKLQGH